MNAAQEITSRLAKFPAPLRGLIDAELAAGNEIAELASSFPAAPVGAYVRFKNPVTTRAHVKTAELDYYDRNTSYYSGEWTDEKRHFFVLEPPRPPEPYPDMDAIREASNRPRPTTEGDRSGQSDAVRRFEESMEITYEKWHDGIGYDVDGLKAGSAADRTAIEQILLRRGVSDWRDVEALAVLETPAAQKALRAAMRNGNAEIRAAVMRHAPSLVPDEQRTSSLVQALKTANLYGGLSQTLDAVAEYHPPEIVVALLRGVLERKAEASIHFAAMVMFLHGRAKTPFDWDHRPFFLKFGTTDRGEREALFRELCAKIGIDARPYLTGG